MAMRHKKPEQRADSRIFLRPFKQSDGLKIYNLAKEKRVAEWTMFIPHPCPKGWAKKYIRKNQYNWKRKKAFACGIVLKGNGKVIGGIELHKINWQNKYAMLGYWLGRKYWNRGLTTEAVQQMLAFGFKQLKLHRIYATLFEKNESSKRVLEKTGFIREGLLREKRRMKGKWQNELVYGLLKNEWRKRGY